MTFNQIGRVLDMHPDLNAYGFGRYPYDTPSERESRFRLDREELRNDVDGCTRAESWLCGMAKRKTINPGRSSYGLKHLAEEEVGYITNGAFICAAIHLGFACDRRSDPNPGFNISEKSVKEAARRISATGKYVS